MSGTRESNSAPGPGLRLVQGGSSNSRPTDTGGRAGFDTVRLFARDLTDSEVERARVGAELRPRGEFRRSVDGVTVGVWGDGRAYVEGRVSAILASPDRRPDDRRLADVAETAETVDRFGFWLSTDRPHEVAFARADLASELAFDRGDDGRRFLSALAELDVPWLKTGTEGGKRSGLETVYWRTATGRSVVMRAYDKATESGEGEPGTRIRVERQRRWRKVRQQTVAEVLGQDLRAHYVGRELAHMIEVAPDRHDFGDVPAALDRVRELATLGRLSPLTAERLAGYLYLRGDGLPVRTMARREAELRRLGISVTFGAEPRTYAVAPLLRELADRFAA